MRYSSMKSFVAAVSIAITLVAAVPTASAAQRTQDSQTSRVRDDDRSRDRLAAIRQFINRTLRRLGVNNGRSIPIPKQVVDVDVTNPE